MKWNVFISLELTKHPGPLWLFFIYLFVCFLPFFLPFFFFTPSPPPPPLLLPPFVIFFRFCFRYSKSVDWKFYAQQISTSLCPPQTIKGSKQWTTRKRTYAYIHICVRVCVFGRNFIIVGTSVHLSTEMFFRANSSVRGEEGRAWSMQRTMIRQNHHRIYVSNIKTHHRQSTRNKIERCGDWIDGDGDG